MRPCTSGFVTAVLLALLAGCAGERQAGTAARAGALQAYPLFVAADAIDKDWMHFRVWHDSDWRLASVDGEVVISAAGQGSSSGLARWVEIDTTKCPAIEWSWRVDALPEQADLAQRDRADAAASLFLAFGDPGSISNPKKVPTLRYAWATAVNPVGAIYDNAYFPGMLRSLVVRSGAEALGSWQTERRDLSEDYRLAFGTDPSEPIQVLSLFTGSANTGKPVQAYYRWARVLCSEPPDGLDP